MRLGHRRFSETQTGYCSIIVAVQKLPAKYVYESANFVSRQDLQEHVSSSRALKRWRHKVSSLSDHAEN